METIEILLWIAPIAISIGLPVIYFAVRINREQYKHGEQLKANETHFNKLHECDLRIEKKIDEYKIKHSLEAEKDRTDFDRKLDRVDDRVDKLNSKMDTIIEKVSESEKVHKEIKQMLKDMQNFFVDWNQRIEDRVEDARSDNITRHRKRRVTTLS